MTAQKHKQLPDSNTMQLRIMTYNIRHASPPTHPNVIDLDTISAVIKKYHPDVVALQEVDVHTGRSGSQIDEAKEIAERTKMHYYFAKAIDFSGGAYGVAILSKFPFDSVKKFSLPSAHDKDERRVLGMAYLQIDKNKKLLFACTHMDSEKDDSSRMLQIKAIDSLLRPQPLPLLLAGDLNSIPGSAVINFLDQNYTRTCLDNCSYSCPSDKPDQAIDFVVFRKTDSFRIINHQVLNEAYPSDHLPVITDLQISFKRKDSE